MMRRGCGGSLGLNLLHITKQSPPPYLAWGGGFGLSAGLPWGVDFLLLLRLALGGGFRLSAGLPGGSLLQTDPKLTPK